MLLNEKGYYFTLLLYGLFSAVSLQKSVRDRMEGVAVTGLYFFLCWMPMIAALALLGVGLWNLALSLSEKGFYAMSFVLGLFAAVAVQKMCASWRCRTTPATRATKNTDGPDQCQAGPQRRRPAGAAMDEKKPRRRGFSLPGPENSGGLDVRSLLAFRALRDFELNFLTFFEGLETIHVDCGEMREQIFAAVIWSDEAKTLGIIEPLNCTCCHKKNLQIINESHEP